MKYDPFQEKAIQAIDEEKSVLVSAPTGAGKTAIAEYAIDKALARGERVIYTAPIKALSNQKYRDFSIKYPDQVGLLTGDVSLNAHAPIMIMTTEIYRNQLFEDPERLAKTSWVIFDEVHYLDDPERGTVWEEAIMFTPEQIRLLCLSATAPNIEEVAQWIRGILHHPIEVIIEPHRPVPLMHLFQCQGHIYNDPQKLRHEGYLDRETWPSGRQQQFGHGGRRRQHVQRGNYDRFLRAKPNRVDELVRHLREEDRLPCIYFAFGRKRTEELAWEQQRFDFLTPAEKTEITELYKKLCERYELTHESSAIEMTRLVERGIAFHHAGMLPTLKEVIEQLFTSKLIKLIFTTETFAIGINMPARSVVFDEYRKFYGTHFGFLRTRDYYQMAGRAGRRGIDQAGYVYSRVNPHDLPFQALLRVVYGKQEPIESQFNSCYATLLNLYAQFGEKLLDIYPNSFHFFQNNRKEHRRAIGVMERKIALLRELGHIDGHGLTEKGQFASWMYGYELLLSELLEEGFLETLDETGLSVLLCSLVYEPRRNQQAAPLSAKLAPIEKRAAFHLRKIHLKEGAQHIFPPTKLPYFNLARAVEAWVLGAPFAEMARYTEADEGELIRYLRMVVQLLRQIKQAPRVSEKLRATASSAHQKVNRDLVDAERQLRNAS